MKCGKERGVMEQRECETAQEARDVAIDWSRWVSEQNLSYGDLADWGHYFEQLAERFPELREEFEENAII